MLKTSHSPEVSCSLNRKTNFFKKHFLDFSWMQQTNENKNNWQEKATAAAEKVEEKAAE